ncbi:DNA repair protein rad10 [Coprinellus micaceus]|uniref:DNA repair protein rad10 n=1 Tax=Coprinellus micaceus TaxID=71717 RepID=A0A4Y7TXF0_COPMI|nr:DNA repair protein rad10 [Coprinellus micaceus]
MASTPTTSSAPAPPVVFPTFRNNVIINPVQRGNPLIECIRNVGKEFGDIPADYQVGRTTGLLFLSLKYHRLHPEYIHQRIEKLGRSYNLRILLILCDVTEHKDTIRELTKTCLVNTITIIVAWSNDEAGHYISCFKQFEHKSPDLIKERTEKDYHSVLRTALTSISKVNKTDVETLRSSFGSFAKISQASTDQLQNLPGFGQVKVKNVKSAFEKPFRNNATATLTSSQARASSMSQPPSSTVPSPRTSNASASGSSTGKATASTPVPSTGSTRTGTAGEDSAFEPPRPGRPPRPPSPEWDIEKDLDDEDEDVDVDTPPRPPSPPRPEDLHRPEEDNLPEGQFDIDLDLN